MLCWLAWFSIKSHPFCPLECACPRRRLGGVFPFPKAPLLVVLLLCKVTSLSPALRQTLRSARLGPWPGTCSRLPGCHLACLVYFCFNSFSFLRTFSRLGNSIGGCPQWLGCQQGGLPAPSWQGENWTLPLPSPPAPRAPGSAWALLRRRPERGVSLPPHFPWGTQPGLLFVQQLGYSSPRQQLAN